MKKDVSIHFRLSKKLKEKIKLESEKSNMTMSQYISNCLNNKSIIVIENGKEIYYELSKIGNNLNQIARKLNSNIATSSDLKKLDNISEEITKIWQLLNSLKSKKVI